MRPPRGSHRPGNADRSGIGDGALPGAQESAEAEGTVIGKPDRLIEIRDAGDGGNGAETFLLHDRHIRRAAGEDGRFIEPADRFALRDFPAENNGCTLSPGILDKPDHLVTRSLAHQRADLGSGQAIADAQAAGFSRKFLDEGIVDAIDHEETLRRCADLARKMEGGGDGTGSGNIERRMRGDDHRIAAAGFDHRRFHLAGGSRGDGPAGGNRTGEGDGVGEAGEGRSDIARPRRHPARRRSTPPAKPRKTVMKSSVDRVVASAGLMMQALPDASEAATVQHINRIGKLKWHDMHAGTERFITRILERPGLRRARHLARLIAGHLGEIAEGAGAIGNFADRFRIGLAHFTRHQFGAGPHIGRLDPVGDPVQNGGAALGVETFPVRLSPLGRKQHGIEFRDRRFGKHALSAECGRVDHRVTLARRLDVVRVPVENGLGWIEHGVFLFGDFELVVKRPLTLALSPRAGRG